MTDTPQNPWPHVYTEQQWADIAYDNDAMSEEYNLQRKLRLMLKPLPSERALDMLAVCLGILNEELAGTWDSATARMQRELEKAK